MGIKKKLMEKRLEGKLDNKFKRGELYKQEIKGEMIGCPPGCDTELGRMVKRGEAGKQHIRLFTKGK